MVDEEQRYRQSKQNLAVARKLTQQKWQRKEHRNFSARAGMSIF
jgi:hypothetical protein